MVDELYHDATIGISWGSTSNIQRAHTISRKAKHEDGEESLRDAQRKHEIEAHFGQVLTDAKMQLRLRQSLRKVGGMEWMGK